VSGAGTTGSRRGVVRVKVCGVTSVEDALAAEAAGADAVGVIVWGRSPRRIDLATAAGVLAPLSPFVQRVGVVVDAPGPFVHEAIARLRLGAVQFHGAEQPAFVAAFRARVAVIRAVSFTPTLDLAQLADLALDALLVDGLRPGSGAAFDWSAATRLREIDRLVVAGGLTPENVAEAVRLLDPLGVDVASGVEIAPGVKDHAALRRFVARAKAAR
jgi:phosphoribosylanthranilate isomerase